MTNYVNLLSSLLGFASLFLAMPRHQQDWLARKLNANASRALRASGFLLLGLAWLISGLANGWGLGTIYWLGWLTVASGMVVAVHSNRERILQRVRR